ncbi:MAG: hypothetical protein KKH68_14370, partial [Proteobacteria bacterium]|nr:hypothetical protein [Pseudomonadota bacterium]
HIAPDTIDLLVKRRLLRREERAGGLPRVELVHDLLTGVIRANRDERHQEQKRRQAEKIERQMRQQVKKLRLTVAVFAVILVAALAGAWFGFSGQMRAEKEAEIARKTMADSDFLQATAKIEADDSRCALAHLARAIRNIRQHHAAARIVSLLMQRSWPLPLTEPMLHKKLVRSANFSPDGKRIVTASDDHTARVWDAVTGKPLTDPMLHIESVTSASFSPDGKRIVTASWDRTARVWDAETGKPLTEPMLHKKAVYSASFSPDGKRIVTASLDNTARVWDLPPPSQIPVPDWLAPLAEAVGGWRLNDKSVLERVDPQRLFTLKEQLRKAKDKDPYTLISRWFFADRSTRPASPYALADK